MKKSHFFGDWWFLCDFWWFFGWDPPYWTKIKYSLTKIKCSEGVVVGCQWLSLSLSLFVGLKCHLMSVLIFVLISVLMSFLISFLMSFLISVLMSVFMSVLMSVLMSPVIWAPNTVLIKKSGGYTYSSTQFTYWESQQMRGGGVWDKEEADLCPNVCRTPDTPYRGVVRRKGPEEEAIFDIGSRDQIVFIYRLLI